MISDKSSIHLGLLEGQPVQPDGWTNSQEFGGNANDDP